MSQVAGAELRHRGKAARDDATKKVKDKELTADHVVAEADADETSASAEGQKLAPPRYVCPQEDDMKLLLSAFYLKVDPARREHWKSVAEEFENRVNLNAYGKHRLSDRVVIEFSLLNQQLVAKYGYDLTSVVPAQKDVDRLLAAFYEKRVPERPLHWINVAKEFKDRVQRSKPGHEWHAEAVLLELVQINNELRTKYGANLNSVARVWIPDQGEEEEEKHSWVMDGVLFLYILFLGALILGMYFFWDEFVAFVKDGSAAVNPHTHNTVPRSQHHSQTVRPMSVNLHVPLEVFYTGGTRTLTYQRQEVCPTCHGTGSKHRHRCNHCSGNGYVHARSPFGIVQVACNACGGSGMRVVEHCHTCSGRGVSQVKKTISVDIKRGMKAGDTVRFPGEGNQMTQANDGELIVNIQQRDHQFKRQGADLHTKMRISLKEALLGFEKEMDFLDGSKVVIKNRTEITQNEDMMLVRGKGMPKNEQGTQFGDLWAKVIKVDMPRTPLTTEQRQKIKELLG